MIDPSRFVYVTLNRHDELKDIVRDELVLHGFDSKQIIFEKPAKFAQVGDYFAIYMSSSKKLYVDEVGKATTQTHGMTESYWVQSDNFLFSVDLSERIKNEERNDSL